MKCMAAPLALMLFLSVSVTQAQYRPVMDYDSNSQQNTIIETTQESQNHKTLLAAVRAADLEETLGSAGPFTVFAPSDVAFEQLSASQIDRLLHPENKKELKAMLTYHIVAGNLTASKILKAMCRGAGTATFTTVNGDELTASMDGIDIVLRDCYGNTARITTADAGQKNGVIHVIDRVILPAQM
ncbi:fasciclin domain-containing protein [Poritiphilus flavus]|uniref:Fasciclin domain-containing protein n=1 Tax=Poritiphilus flavus TaxID=2697053 RepID=A0A6L9EFB2_9FLAO|nr:fasciclin domain-containing protein [Poritiphilus flavus]NAS13427.1 fasciclin domain-containing protein [Poritiphilus flavus]